MDRTNWTHPRRLLSLLLAWLLCVSCVQPALAASETAKTVQLMKTEGTVSVTNNGGKSVSQRDNMRLYNGYQAETEKASYAWFNLDDAKLAKLDAVSELELRKSGKKLELLLNSGNLFFNVTEPLEEDETLNIRTSTMVVGIRGTCGWVKVIDRWNTQVYILEGRVECRVSDPVTGEIKSTILTGGETASFVVYPQDREGDKCDIIKDRFTEDDIPGFVLVELVDDVDLCDEIYDDSGLDILGDLAKTGGGDPSGKTPNGDAATPEAIDEAYRRLKEDEDETARKLEDVREQEEGQEHNISKDPVWEDKKPAQTPTGPVNQTPTPPLTPDTPVTPPAAPEELTMKITDDEAGAALVGANAVVVQPNSTPVNDDDNILEVDSGLTVPAGKSLTLQPGINVHVLEGQSLQVDGTLDVAGGNVGNYGDIIVTSSNTLHVVGGLVNGDPFVSGGRITVTATGRVVVDGELTNYGGTLNLTRGATVKARGFNIMLPYPEGWRESDTPDEDGYYTLVAEGDPDPVPGTDPTPGTGDMEWDYDEATQTLTIWGSGRMQNYFSADDTLLENPAPWSEYANSARTVEISGITSIGTQAFSNFTSLESVTIPDDITEIWEYAFYNCSSLTNITIPARVTRIGGFAFSGCSSLTSIHIPDGVTRIEYGTFEDCSSLTNINIPNGVTSIGQDAFRGCSSLTNINIPNGVTSIGQGAFFGCSSLTSITIPDRVTSIDNHVFWACTSLTSITIPAGVTSIGTGAFYACFGLTSITIPDGVTSIEDMTFNSCSGLTSITIPDGVTSIGSSAFTGCSGLTSITIPDGVTSIGSGTFSNCTGLTSITIPDGVTSIGEHTFFYCTDLTSITIPDGVTSIGDFAFSGCNNLKDIYYTGTEAQWGQITIGTDNDPLFSAEKHYNNTRSITNAAPAPDYTDVSPDAWYAEAVAYCREHGLMNGTSATEFSPDGTLTRAMMVTVLHRMAGEPAAAAAASFRDVEAGQWYTEAVSWASANGIVLGYGNGLFGTDDSVTHEQVALLLQRRSGDADVHVYGADEPQAPATRAEIAATLMDYVKAHPNTLPEVSAMDVMCEPSGIALLPDGSLLVTDTYNRLVWQVSNGVSRIYAGSDTVEDLYGKPLGGYNDALLTESYFKTPWAIAPFLDGWAVSDTENGAVRLISSEITQTVNGRTKEKLQVSNLGVVFTYPTGLAADEEGNLYVSDTHENAIRKITPDGEVTTFAKNLSEPMGLCWKDGVLYAAETGANRIVKIVNGTVTVLAGSGEEGLTDGPAAQAAFSGPKGVAVDEDGTVYVADTANSAVRQIRDGQVTTLAVRDVTDLNAFSPVSPVGLLVRGRQLYICDNFSRKLFVLQLG